jgi:hypothetical protein
MRRWIALAGGLAALALTGTALAMVGGGWAPDAEEKRETGTLAVAAMAETEDRSTATTVASMEKPPTTEAKGQGFEEPKEPKQPEDAYGPELSVLYPEDGQVFEEKTVAFKGTTTPGTVVFAGKWEADVDADGNWTIVLVLSEGANRAKFTATDAAGNQSVASITVHYKPATSTTTTKPKADEPPKVDFSASAKFGSGAGDPAYDVYYGTGEPGTHVYVLSDFGGGKGEINDKGKWHIKVFFEGAPVGKPFQVKVKDDFGNYKMFEFVRTD